MPPTIPPIRPTEAGWDWLLPDDLRPVRAENIDPSRPLQEQVDEADEASQDILDTFLTPAGQRVLQRWWKFVTMQPGFDPAVGYENGVAMGFAREGQRALLASVIATIERYKERASRGGLT